jgi:outer membrane protein assembly factor BamB
LLNSKACTRFASLFLLCGSMLTAQVAVTTYQNDNYRSGANTHETTLTTANVNVSHFGRKAVFPVQGQVYAQPLYLPNLTINGVSHNVVLIATEHDQVYAFDANSGQQLWHTNLLVSHTALITISSISSGDVNCTDMTPEIGITGTPVIDTTTNVMYFVALTKETSLTTHQTTFYQTLHELDIHSGIDIVAPHRIAASAPGIGTGSLSGTLTFDPLVEGQRPAMLLHPNGQLIIGWASHCDLGSYHGWLMAFNKSNLANTAVWVDTPNGVEGGFWASGSGAAADASGSIYVPTGNGTFDANTGGSDYGDSVLRLTWSTGSFTMNDYFTPWDQQNLDNEDGDVASGGVLLLPDQPGAQYPHLLLQVGKEGTIDLINRDNMGHFHSGSDSQIVQTLPFANDGVWGAEAFWNNTAYFGPQYGHMQAFAFNPSTQKLSTSPTSTTTASFNFPGPTPAVSANGTTNGIVWAIQSDNPGGVATLHAYDATNLATELYNSEQNPSRDRAGLPVKFAVPTVADGHVFVGVQNQVSMYGLLN